MADDEDGSYATAREHWRLVERVATVEADMRQIGPALARIETAVAAARVMQPTPQETAGALALHRAVDALDRASKGGSSPFTTVLSYIGAIALGAVAVYALLHH